MVGEVAVTAFSKDGEQVGRAEEAGAEEAVVGFDLVDEMLRYCGAQVFGRQVHVQGEDVAGLGVRGPGLEIGVVDAEGRALGIRAGDEAVGLDEFLGESGFYVAKQVRVFGFFFGLAEGVGHLLHEGYVVGPGCGCDECVFGWALG